MSARQHSSQPLLDPRPYVPAAVLPYYYALSSGHWMTNFAVLHHIAVAADIGGLDENTCRRNRHVISLLFIFLSIW